VIFLNKFCHYFEKEIEFSWELKYISSLNSTKFKKIGKNEPNFLYQKIEK